MKVTDRQYALELDKNDPLARFKSQFVISDPEMCYLDGNSLGRLPKATVTAINDFMTKEWGPEVVTGWSHWVDEAQPTGDLLGEAALGAGPGQVLVCDTTSVNFYQLCLAAISARPGRKTIITDAANFPTDRYILDGIAKSHGLKLVIIDNEDPEIAENELDFANRLLRLAATEQLEAIVTELDKAAYHIERNANPKILFMALTIKIYHIIKDKTLILVH